MTGRTPLLVLNLISAAAVLASDAPMDRATLQGLKAVKVVVEAPSNAAKLSAQIEQRLAKEGIPVDKDAAEFLGLRITFARGRKTDYALALNLAAYQKVTLARDPNLKTTAETWSGDSVLLTPPKLLDEAIANTVDQLVDQFIAAYRSVNPK